MTAHAYNRTLLSNNRNELHEATWLNLKCTVLSERSIYSKGVNTWASRKSQSYRDREQTSGWKRRADNKEIFGWWKYLDCGGGYMSPCICQNLEPMSKTVNFTTRKWKINLKQWYCTRLFIATWFLTANN